MHTTQGDSMNLRAFSLTLVLAFALLAAFATGAVRLFMWEHPMP